MTTPNTEAVEADVKPTGSVSMPCCGYHDPTAVMWNPYNKVVQCHNCGRVWVPRSDPSLSQDSAQEIERPKIVCICGSTRFAEHMNTEAERLTLAGYIVVRPEVVAYNRERDQQFVEPDVKERLDVLHLHKINLSDEVVVVTVNGYVGESTRREIAYAEQTGKPVHYSEYQPAQPSQEQRSE